jgi:hypothetical protein
VIFLVEEIPEAFSAAAREGVFDLDGAAELFYVGGLVGAGYAVPARIGIPLGFEFRQGGRVRHYAVSWGRVLEN